MSVDSMSEGLRTAAADLLAGCPDVVTRTLRATGEQMRIACVLCREAAARLVVAADLLDKPLPWHKES